jgi:penicillin amidase
MVRRLLLYTLATLIALALGGGALLFWTAKRAEPAYAGEATLPGLFAPVTVRYGAHAVPSIEAEGLADLLFAQGYVVASERMWQMDLLRRLASGRLAEVMGERALAADRFFRTVGLARAAAASLEALEEPYRGYLDAYAAGVNAYRTQAAGRLPPEYLIARFEPAPWTPEDSLVVAEYMAWMLSFNAREELVYLRLAARVGKERALELFPTDEGVPAPEDARDLPDYRVGAVPDLEGIFAVIADLGLPVPGPASNAWAINGERTEDGGALLANDVHLAPSVPGIWYELELRAPGYHAAGAALPGAPFVVIGHNEDLAWGFTTTMADTQDIFVERPTDDGTAVDRPTGTEPIATRTETIAVKDRPEPLELTVRSTSHGVVINDILGEVTGTPVDMVTLETPYLLALRTNLDRPDRAIPAIYGLNTATDLSEARAAVADLRHTAMNLMLADRKGNIGWQVSGLLPERGRGSGAFPVPGWEPGYGWRGYVDPKRNPGLINPAGFALVTANQRTIPVDFEVQVSHSWMAPYRARRIEDMLGARNPQTPDDLAHMQMDRVSLEAKRFKQAIARVASDLRVLDPQARRTADEYLMTWDGGFQGDSRPAALYALLQPALYQALFGDELGEDLPALESIAVIHYNALQEAMYSGKSSFWDDVRTVEREGAAHVWARALRQAKDELDRRLPQLGAQRLDAIRSLTFPHAFHRVPVLHRLFDVGPLPAAGDTQTVNTMKASPAEPDKGLIVPSLRLLYVPNDWTASRLTLPLGQSGHRFSPYRTDQLDDWLTGGAHRLQWDGPTSGEEIGAMVLRPAPAQATQPAALDSPEPKARS